MDFHLPPEQIQWENFLRSYPVKEEAPPAYDLQ